MAARLVLWLPLDMIIGRAAGLTTGRKEDSS